MGLSVRILNVAILHFKTTASDSTVMGKAFQLDNESAVIVRGFLEGNIFKRKPVTPSAKTPFFDLVVPVTGASSNHFGELMANMNYFARHFPGTNLYCYDIGLDAPQVSQLKKLPSVIYRKFNFDKYPPHIKNLRNYAWKILITGELLAEFDGVMWFDTSVRIHGDVSHLLERLARFKPGMLFFLKLGPRTHSIAAATDPGMMAYFPLTPQGKSGLVDDMLPGGTILVLNTADVQEHVMKWASICALVQECMARNGTTIICPNNIWTIPRDQFAGCQRYDQALFSLLVTNLYSNQRERYSLNDTEAIADLGFLGKKKNFRGSSFTGKRRGGVRVTIHINEGGGRAESGILIAPFRLDTRAWAPGTGTSLNIAFCRSLALEVVLGDHA